MNNDLSKMNVEALENLSYQLTEQRQALRKQALKVQQVLGTKLEAKRISDLLGRPVQIIEVKSIEGAEQIGDIK